MIKGCKHYATKTIKMAGGGSVPSKTLKTEKNPDGSQQYVRGNTKREKLNTIKKVSDTTSKMYDDASDAVTRTFNRPAGEEFDKKKYTEASEKGRKAFKAYMSTGDAFIDELDRK